MLVLEEGMSMFYQLEN